MNEYNFQIPSKNLKGEVEEGRTVSDCLCELLGTETKGNYVKYCHWYGTLMAKKPLQLDEPDKNELITYITNTERQYLFIKMQILDVLKDK